MRYELQHMDTVSGIGCFAAHPGPNLSFNEAMDYLRQNPLDSFMHEFLLDGMSRQRPRKVEKLIKECMAAGNDPVLAALLYEACLSHARLEKYLPLFNGHSQAEHGQSTPSIHIASHELEDREVHGKWASLFGDHLAWNTELPAPDTAGLPLPGLADAPAAPQATAAQIRARLADEGRLPAPLERIPVTETSARAIKLLETATIPVGGEMQHRAALSPLSLLRHWKVDISMRTGDQTASLTGMQTVYGRGFDVDTARASYSMEMIERASAYTSVNARGLVNRSGPSELIKARFSELNAPALDPNAIRLEVPYADQPIYWMHGQVFNGQEHTPILIPAQFIFLFWNLDEPQLFSALGSTGLASGNTMFEARLSGLYEALERDAEAVQPLDLARCFRLEAEPGPVADLLASYEDCGIQVWFMDLTNEFGIPCYKAMVTGKRGDVNRGTGAGLDGKRALLSGMTETPYPLPGPASAPAPKGLPVRKFEDLPDLSTGSAEGDLMVVEHTLAAGGYSPVYADLTRKDFGLPVTRALIPGMELISDFDHYSRISPRLWRNYLSLF